MQSPSGFSAIADALLVPYLQAKSFTIKEVPIPQVKDDEVLLKGGVFSLNILNAYVDESFFFGSHLLWHVRGRCQSFRLLGKLISDGRSFDAVDRLTLTFTTANSLPSSQ